MKISGRGTIQPRATVLDIKSTPLPAPVAAIDPDTEQRRKAAQRLAREGQVVDLTAAGERLLDQMEADPAQNPFTFSRDAVRAFAAEAGERLGDARGVADRVEVERLVMPAFDDFFANARDMQRELEDISTADTVFRTAQGVIEAAQENPIGKGLLFDRVLDLAQNAPLSPERRNEVAAAVATRAMSLGLDDLLGERFDEHRPRAREMLAENERRDREAAGPEVLLAGVEVPEGSVPSPQTAQDREPGASDAPQQVQDLLAALQEISRDAGTLPLGGPEDTPVDDLATALEDVFPQGPSRPVQQSLSRLEDGERTELEAAIARLRELDAPNDVVRRVVEDVARGFGARQQSAAMVIPLAVGVAALVILSLEVQRRRGSAEGAGEATAEFFDRLIDDMRGLFQEGGDKDDDAGQGGDGRDLTRDDNVPPEPVDGPENEGGDKDPGSEKHPNIVAAGAVIAALLMNRFEFNKDFRVEDIQRAAEESAEKLLGPEPDSIDPEMLKQALRQLEPEVRSRIEEIQAARDVLNASPEDIDALRDFTGEKLEGALRQRFGGDGPFTLVGEGTLAEFDGALPNGTWYEAKGGGQWQSILERPARLDQFRDQIVRQKKLAKLHNRKHALITNGRIPKSIRTFLRDHNVIIVEIIK